MKGRFFFCVFLFGLCTIGFAFTGSASTAHHYSIPEPVSDAHNLYIAVADRLFQFRLCSPVNTVSFDRESKYTLSDAHIIQSADSVFGAFSVSVSGSSTTITTKFGNLSRNPVDIYVIVYRTDGSNPYVYDHFVVPSSTYITNPDYNLQPGSYDFSFSYGDSDPGLWFSEGWVPAPSSSPASYSLLQVTWSDTIDYKSDFTALNILLEQWSSTDQDFQSVVKTLLTNISNSESSFFSWFRSSYYNAETGYWDSVLLQFDRANTALYNIYQALGGGQEQTTIAGETELYQGVNDLHDSESQYLGSVDSNNEQIGQYGDLALREANGSLTNGFVFVKGIFDEVISYKPNMILMVFVLVFGVIMLILGKRVSRD